MKTLRHGRSAIRIDRLQETSLFSNCTKDELRTIASLTSMKDVEQGVVLAEQGTAGRLSSVPARSSGSLPSSTVGHAPPPWWLTRP